MAERWLAIKINEGNLFIEPAIKIKYVDENWLQNVLIEDCNR